MFFFCQRLIPCFLVLCKMFCSLSSLHLEVITCPLSHLIPSILYHVFSLASCSLSFLCSPSYILFSVKSMPSVLHPVLCLTSCSLSYILFSVFYDVLSFIYLLPSFYSLVIKIKPVCEGPAASLQYIVSLVQ
jgi:hypothetical protein